MKIKFEHTLIQYFYDDDYDLLIIIKQETQKFKSLRSLYKQTFYYNNQINSDESVQKNAHKKIMIKTLTECHSQSSKMSITELLTDDTEQDTHERIMTKTLQNVIYNHLK